MKVLGILLAGGLSRRMGGGDKGLMPLGGKPLLSYALDKLEAQTDAVIINANGDPNRFKDFDAPIVHDTLTGFAGPLAGILAGLRFAQKMNEKPDFIASAAADTPFFPNNLVIAFKNQIKTDKTIVLATSNGQRHPVFGLWPVALADDLENWLSNSNNRKVLAWVNQHEWAISDFEAAQLGKETIDPFFNINTPEDFSMAESLLEGIDE